MKYIYELQHFYEDEEGYEIVTDIAVYSNKKNAEQALRKFKKHKKFKLRPDNFAIGQYELDQDNWTEGFFIYTDDDEDNQAE